jgi:hypothetical protein
LINATILGGPALRIDSLYACHVVLVSPTGFEPVLLP